MRSRNSMFRTALAATTEEARRFVSDLVWNGGNFTGIFTSPDTADRLNGDPARIYKVDPPAHDFDRVAFPANSERAGLLGQALFLTMTAKPDDTSPTARGLFVREQFLCQHVADPPPGVNTNLPPVTESRPVSNRERLAMHTTNKTCAGCHDLIDPIGFGFEKFDAIGQRRDRLKLTFGMLVGESKKPERNISTTVGKSISIRRDRWPGFRTPRLHRRRNWERCWRTARNARNASSSSISATYRAAWKHWPTGR